MLQINQLPGSVRFSFRAIAIVAALSVAGFSANEAQAQHRGVSNCQGGVCVQPPQRDYCCQPRLGFVGRTNCYGMLVLNVEPYSLACQMGLHAGDTILKINGRRVTSHAQFQHMLHEALIYNGGFVSLFVQPANPYAQPVVLRTQLAHSCGGGVAHRHGGGF